MEIILVFLHSPKENVVVERIVANGDCFYTCKSGTILLPRTLCVLICWFSDHWKPLQTSSIVWIQLVGLGIP